jgi:hypothetical protein
MKWKGKWDAPPFYKATRLFECDLLVLVCLSSAITNNSDPFLCLSRTSILHSNGRETEGNRQRESSFCRQRTEVRGVVEIRPFNNLAWVLAYQDIFQERQARLWRRYCLPFLFPELHLIVRLHTVSDVW